MIFPIDQRIFFGFSGEGKLCSCPLEASKFRMEFGLDKPWSGDLADVTSEAFIELKNEAEAQVKCIS